MLWEEEDREEQRCKRGELGFFSGEVWNRLVEAVGSYTDAISYILSLN